MASEDFSFPFFYSYPPYFTLQPVQETREKQSGLWRDLILKYCKHYKVYKLSIDSTDELPLFVNKAIDRRLSSEARAAFVSDLVKQGNAQWLDKLQRQVLILWKRLDEWAATIHSWARESGLEDMVTTVEELSSGDDTRGTELDGLPHELLIQALRLLEARGKAKLFKGTSADDEGVKFFA
ncbi:hypothetical protein WJX72_002089 [[Myrmecia] bisecta]|uniref:ESCRT-II complex subunit VPS25 n=1 Tax=[Myrmecia] bisecta TaxID=41462 RepID=A0AAW1QEE2_9CHLO